MRWTPWSAARDSSIMDDREILLYRTDPTRNMARFYAMAIAPTLFGDVSLVRRWGRIGTTGRLVIELYPDRAAALGVLAARLRQKTRRGYRGG